LTGLQRLNLHIFGFARGEGHFASCSANAVISSLPSHIKSISLVVHGFRSYWEMIELGSQVDDVSLLGVPLEHPNAALLPAFPTQLTRLRVSTLSIPPNFPSALRSLCNLESFLLTSTLGSRDGELEYDDTAEDSEILSAMHEFNLDWLSPCFQKMRFLVLHVSSLRFDPKIHRLPSLEVLKLLHRTEFVTPDDGPNPMLNSPETRVSNCFAFSKIIPSSLRWWGNLTPSIDPEKLPCWSHLVQYRVSAWKTSLSFPPRITALNLTPTPSYILDWDSIVPLLPQTLLRLSVLSVVPQKTISKLPSSISHLGFQIPDEWLDFTLIEWPKSLTKLENHSWLNPSLVGRVNLNLKRLRSLPQSVSLYGHPDTSNYFVRACEPISLAIVSEAHPWVSLRLALAQDRPDAIEFLLSTNYDCFISTVTALSTLCDIVQQRSAKIATWILNSLSSRIFFASNADILYLAETATRLPDLVNTALTSGSEAAKPLLKLILAHLAQDDFSKDLWLEILALKANLEPFLHLMKERQRQRGGGGHDLIHTSHLFQWIREGRLATLGFILNDWKQSIKAKEEPLLTWKNRNENPIADPSSGIPAALGCQSILEIFCNSSSSDRTASALNLMIPEAFFVKEHLQLLALLDLYESSYFGQIGIFDAIYWLVTENENIKEQLKDVNLLERILLLAMTVIDETRPDCASTLILWILNNGFPIMDARFGPKQWNLAHFCVSMTFLEIVKALPSYALMWEPDTKGVTAVDLLNSEHGADWTEFLESVSAQTNPMKI
jgi:hypothetical protein